MGNDDVFGRHHSELLRARADAARLPLSGLNVADRDLYETDTVLPYLERLRRECPIHFCAESADGSYWLSGCSSMTKSAPAASAS